MFVTDILSLKGLFLCLRIATYLLMGKRLPSAQMGHYLLSEPTLPTFPTFYFLEKNHHITLQTFRGMAWRKYRQEKKKSQFQNIVQYCAAPKSVSFWSYQSYSIPR